MIIRTATVSDLPALVALHRASFEAGWDNDALTPFIKLDAVTCVGTPIAGFVIITKVGEEAEIITLAVAPDRRRNGIARTLLRNRIEVLEQGGVGSLFLEVATDNEGALGLYRGLGFLEVGLRKGYYRQSDGSYRDAHVLSRQLNPPRNVAKR
jgi:[ribosomal protein S18]-alanine N-acetyltransferase